MLGTLIDQEFSAVAAALIRDDPLKKSTATRRTSSNGFASGRPAVLKFRPAASGLTVGGNV